jgi:5'-nucleotidase
MKKATPLLALLLSLAVCLPGCTSVPKADPKAAPNNTGPKIAGTDKGKDPGTFHAHLLSINDFHGQIDVTRKVNGRNVGRADYLAAYLKQRIASYPDKIVVHAGDAVGASAPTSALLHDEPTINILNSIGFDAGTIGNHEFDHGVDEMMRQIHGGNTAQTGSFKGANFPYVCANVVTRATGHLILPPYIIKKVRGVPVGIIGVVLKDTPTIAMPRNVASVNFLDEATTINKYVKELKGKGVKAIVVLAHNPGTSAPDGGNPNGQVVDIAHAVDPEVDVILAGHSHQYLNSFVDRKLLVQAYSFGTYFADVDLVLDHKTKDIVQKTAAIIPTYQDGIQPDPMAASIISQAQQQAGPVLNQMIGTAQTDITASQNVHGESALGNLIADSHRAATGTQLAFMNPGGIRSDIHQGPVTWGNLYTVQPFNNDLMTMNLTGSQIRALLNQQWQGGSKKMLQISGMRYTWDSTRPEGDRVVDMVLPNGAAIAPGTTYSVTVNAFLASGGDGFTTLLQGTNRVIGPVDLDACVNYIKGMTQPFGQGIEGRIQMAQ